MPSSHLILCRPLLLWPPLPPTPFPIPPPRSSQSRFELPVLHGRFPLVTYFTHGSGEGNGTPLHYSCLENPVDAGAWWAAVPGVAASRTPLSGFAFSFHFSLSCIGEGNGNPLQCSCLENPRDEGAWWAAVCGVAQSRTRLKRLSSSSSSVYVSILISQFIPPSSSQPLTTYPFATSSSLFLP